MSNPQQPELARSRKTPHQDQDSVASIVDGQATPSTGGPSGPVPPQNQPGNHPPEEQDKPDLDAFAEHLGVTDEPAAEAVPRQLAVAEPGTDARTKVAIIGAVVVALLAAVMLRRRSRRRR